MDTYNAGSSNFDDYEYEYEYEDEDSARLFMPTWAIPIIVLVSILYVSFNLLLVVVILSKPKLRQRPGNWLIVNLAAGLIVKGILFLIISRALYWLSWEYAPGFCQVLFTLYYTLTTLIPMNVLMITVEHYVSIVKSGGSESGFSKPETRCCIAGVAAGVIIFTLIMIFGVGNGFETFANSCYMDKDKAHMVVAIVHILILIATIVMTAIVIVKWYRSDKGDTKNVAMPLVLVNTFYIIFRFLGSLMPLWFFSHCVGIGLPLVWLISSNSLRRAYRQTCCPCCPGDKDDDEEKHLLENN